MSNFHSIKTLEARGLDSDTAKTLRAIVINHCAYLMRVMGLANELLGGHGVESAHDTDGFYLEYVNMGDTYDMTLTYYRGKYRYCSWGDIVEANFNKFE